jgi:hypothetical protein
MWRRAGSGCATASSLRFRDPCGACIVTNSPQQCSCCLAGAARSRACAGGCTGPRDCSNGALREPSLIGRDRNTLDALHRSPSTSNCSAALAIDSTGESAGRGCGATRRYFHRSCGGVDLQRRSGVAEPLLGTVDRATLWGSRSCAWWEDLWLRRPSAQRVPQGDMQRANSRDLRPQRCLEPTCSTGVVCEPLWGR